MQRPSHFRADIQGLRGIAVLLVVLFHAWPRGVPGGYVGVDVFFVISGYLITGLLVRELEASGGIDFKAFYARRIRRLLPAAALVITATVVAVSLLYPPFETAQLAPTAIAAAAYVSNIWFAVLSVDYLQEGLHKNLLLHTWSLGVEEQFYLVWPALLLGSMLVLRRMRRRHAIAWMVAGVCVLSFLGSVWLTGVVQSWAFFSLPTRAWELGVGASAFLLESRAGAFSPRLRRAMTWAGLACIVAAAFVFSNGTRYPGYAALLPVLGGFLAITGNMQGESRFDLFCAAWLQRLGDWSYSWYLWHWPVLIILGDVWQPGRKDLVPLAGVVASLLAAALTYRFLENPARHNLFRDNALKTLGFGIAIMAVTAGVAGAGWFAANRDQPASTRQRMAKAERDRPQLYQDRCFATALDSDVPECMYGTADGKRTVALIGDSHAAQWFPALESLALKSGWRLAVYVKANCPVALVEPFDTRLNRPYTECTQWREKVFARLAELRPTLVIGGNSSLYAPFESRDPQEIEAWRKGLESALRRLTASAGHVALIRDTPQPGFHVPVCLARAGTQAGRSPAACVYQLSTSFSKDAVEVERAAVASVAGAAFIDLLPSICATSVCRVERDGMVLFHDSQHISATFARSLASPLWRQLPAATRAALSE